MPAAAEHAGDEGQVYSHLREHILARVCRVTREHAVGTEAVFVGDYRPGPDGGWHPTPPGGPHGPDPAFDMSTRVTAADPAGACAAGWANVVAWRERCREELP